MSAADEQHLTINQPAAAVRRSQFAISEERDPHGSLRLVPRGDLDLASAPRLQARLDELAAEGTPVRLDVSGIEFIDSSGLRVLVNAVRDARPSGRRLEIYGAPAKQVQRVFELTGFDRAQGPDATDR